MLQEPAEVLFQLEVTDTTGLPLPDARLELFAYVEGGTVREWVAIEPRDLPPAIPFMFRRATRSDCAMLLAWLRGR